MQFLLLFKADSSLFDQSEIEQIFRSNSNFRDLRVNDSGGDLVACRYVESDDWALIDLGEDRQSICFSNTGHAALRAVLLIQQALGVPMRVYNDTYTFDLTFSDISTVEELEAAMDNARTS
jgi:hypothetical protein